MKHRVFLVDDEALAIRRLTKMLEATGRVDIVGSTTDPGELVARVRDLRLDAIFLDIAMPGMDGFAVARALPDPVKVIFTTAFDAHALRAFEVNVVDYLLKPIREADLVRALDKLDHQIVTKEAAGPARLISRLGDKFHFVELERVSHFYAEDKLTYAVTPERSYVVDVSITDLEAQYAGFFRIHRSTLVKLSVIAELHTDGTRVRLTSGEELVVARDRVRALKDRLAIP
ncbi:MAG: LytTR family DNA-binding domain-containing protein [Kofleriaceae bacterium]